MAVDQDALADVVVMTVKAAMAASLGPILERLAATEARQAMSGDTQKALSDLRDRIVTVETKAATPQPEPVLSEPVDLGPILERLAVAETRLNMHLPTAEKALGELRDRVVVVETKAAPVVSLEPIQAPPVTDLGPLQERLAAAEARLSEVRELRDRVVTVEAKATMPSSPDPSLSDLRERVQVIESKAAPVVDLSPALERVAEVRDRLLVLETKAAAPTTPPTEKAVDLGPVEQRVSRLELQLEMKAAEVQPMLSTLADLTKDVSAIRERVAVVEVRPPVPGPPGEPGPPGTNGTDGRPGLSFQGVWQEGKSYDLGQLVTWAGSSWHCNELTNTKPGEGSKAWTLMVKRGRDGRDGKDAESALPVISVAGAR